MESEHFDMNWLVKNAPNTYMSIIEYLNRTWAGSSNWREHCTVTAEDAGSCPVQPARNENV